MDTPVTTVQDLIDLLSGWPADMKLDFVNNRQHGDKVKQWVVDNYGVDYNYSYNPTVLNLNIYPLLKEI